MSSTPVQGFHRDPLLLCAAAVCYQLRDEVESDQPRYVCSLLVVLEWQPITPSQMHSFSLIRLNWSAADWYQLRILINSASRVIPSRGMVLPHFSPIVALEEGPGDGAIRPCRRARSMARLDPAKCVPSSTVSFAQY